MSKRLLLNLGLLGLLVVLALLVWRELAPEEDAGRLTRLAAAEVERIVVERPRGEMLRLAREHGGWRLLEPRSLPASEFHVDHVLELLEARSDSRFPAAEMDLEALGLAEPRVRVALGDAVFVFGGVEPLSQRRYVLLGDEVFLIRDTLTPLLLGPWWNFIDRGLLGLTDEIVAVELADGRLLVGADARHLLGRWERTAASIVKPMAAADDGAGEVLEMRLASGDSIRWLAVDDDEPRLLRPDLGLAYHLDRQTLKALTAAEVD